MSQHMRSIKSNSERLLLHRLPRRKRRISLNLEHLEARLAPAVFNLVPGAADGAAGSLRVAIEQADTNSDASNTINLAAGAYTLTQSGLGNLLVQDENPGTPEKSFLLVGQGEDSTIIEPGSASWDDRIFEVVSKIGANVTVAFQDLTIEKGSAKDGGVLGGSAALGGGLLIDGGRVTLSQVSVMSNTAAGANGKDGATGAPGKPGSVGGKAGDAEGAGIYMASGQLTLISSAISFNTSWGGSAVAADLGALPKIPRA